MMMTLFLLLLVSCGNRRTGMEQRGSAAGPERHGTRVDTFAADYRPPAGIKYQPKVVTDGAKTINVAAGLKHVRAMKAREWGTPALHATGVETHSFPWTIPLQKVDSDWVLQAAEGLFLLDDKFRAVKQLYRNDVDITRTEEEGTIHMNIHSWLEYVGYDDSLRQLRAKHGGKTGYYLANLPWDELRASVDTFTADRFAGLLPLYRKKESVYVMRGGYFASERFSSRVYTFGMRGDTLCRFTVNDAEDYQPAADYRVAETDGNVYVHGGKPRFRVGYDDTVYELQDAATLKAVWRLDFGGLRRPSGKEVVESLFKDLGDCWFVGDFLETDRHIFLNVSEGHDCPRNRESNQVKLHTLVYDKQTAECFCLPSAKDEKGRPMFPEVPFTYRGKSFSGKPSGVADGMLYFVFSGKQLKEQQSGVPEIDALGDGETVIVTMERQ